jgi:predicted nucleic acid-binding protein
MQSAVERLLRDEPGELVVPLPVATETDYLLGVRGGRAARLGFIDDLAAGRLVLAGLTAADVATVRDLELRYPELDAGLADLSIVVVAARHRTNRIATFDEHFRVLRPLAGSDAFEVLPVERR